MMAWLGDKHKWKPRYKCHQVDHVHFLLHPYEAEIQRDRNPRVHDNKAGAREKDRGPTHTSVVSASESLKGTHEPDPQGQSD